MKSIWQNQLSLLQVRAAKNQSTGKLLNVKNVKSQIKRTTTFEQIKYVIIHKYYYYFNIM